MKLKVNEVYNRILQLREAQDSLRVLEAVLNGDVKLHDKVFVENRQHGDVLLTEGMLTGVCTMLRDYNTLLDSIVKDAEVEVCIKQSSN